MLQHVSNPVQWLSYQKLQAQSQISYSTAEFDN